MAFSKLPGDVISRIISLTTPQDACRASLISTSFKSAADSDQVWLHFLPPDCNIVIPQISSKKSLYLHLCDHPTPISGNRNMIFSLDKKSGKKCFMIGAIEICGILGKGHRSWGSISESNSRFDQVVHISHVCWSDIMSDIMGRVETKMLSPRTTYAAYFVCRIMSTRSVFCRPAISRVSSESNEHGEWPNAIFHPLEGEPQFIKNRGDGWLEIETGEFYTENGDNQTLVCHLKEVDHHIWYCDLAVEGIELRPKEIS